jgi:hypothetical protein
MNLSEEYLNHSTNLKINKILYQETVLLMILFYLQKDKLNVSCLAKKNNKLIILSLLMWLLDKK